MLSHVTLKVMIICFRKVLVKMQTKIRPSCEKYRVICLSALFSCIFIGSFVCLRLYVPVNNFSVSLGRLPGFNHVYSAMGMKCLAQGHNTVLFHW